MKLRFRIYIAFTILLCAFVPFSHSIDQRNRSLRIATAQIPVSNSISENSATIHRALEVAIKEGADILLTPEGSLSGYTPKFDQAKVDEKLRKIVKGASKAGMALALGTCYIEANDKNVTIRLDSMTVRECSWVFAVTHFFAGVFLIIHRVKSMIMQSAHCVPSK